MADHQIIYFDRPGPKNTARLVQCVRQRVEALGIRHVVLASNTGDTALAVADALDGLDVNIVCVTEHAGWQNGDALSITDQMRAEVEKRGVRVLTCSHALSGVARSITEKFGGVSHVEIIAHTLRLMCEGMKVAVEVAVMAADAGLIPTDCEIVAIGGTGRGADTAAILRAAHMNSFFDLDIREILAKPRGRKAK